MPIITTGPETKSDKTRKGNPVRGNRSTQAEYVRAMSDAVKDMQEETRSIGRQVRAGLGPTEASALITQNLQRSNARFQALSQTLPANFVAGVSQDNKNKIQRMLKNALGVNSVTFIDVPKIAEELEIAALTNAELIGKIPNEHFSKVADSVLRNFRGDTFVEGSLTKRLAKIGSIAQDRVKFIARDQTAKLVNNLNELRQQEAGITKYIWRTQKDERVVGTPGGLYPKGNRGHLNHFKREGDTFEWANPPADGHPSQAFGCRCFAEPVLDLEEVKKSVTNV